MSRPRGPVPDDARARRRAERDWIRTHHPDVGGDPAAFAAGLAALRAGRAPATGALPRPRVTVVRSRGPRACLRRLLAPRRPPRTRPLR
ncbi:hypothetical protein SAMN05660690_3340 [Geodermatophilus telluris]|uniref:Uncharacterized protein n=1 Tax=Geodermatophilus telluris TaxID=1190417 RepID=A0A1G6RWN8_9ACTN|nr:hypothetical protein [Geodermatophilus telluris]SDD08853.1 hypothetical protein SAMN05660690_3340 [Geodermatophilus telluris]